MDTVVTKLEQLYKEMGGTKEVTSTTTSADLIGYLAEVFGISDTTIIPYSQETIFNYNVSDLQEDLVVANGTISGKLKYLDSGDLVTAHGAGNFFAVEFSDKDSDATSIKMGMYPTFKNGEFVYDDSGLSDVIADPDKGGAWKVTDKNVQYFKVVTSDGKRVHTQLFKITADLLPAED